MIKILWMVGILALGVAGVLFGICGWEYFRAAPENEQDTGLSVVEEFKRAGNRNTEDVQKASPLVQQAEVFALYLNPPAPPKQEPKPHIPENIKIVTKKLEIMHTEISPKFELHGISYYRSKPQESMALVWEPGSGHRWIKKGAMMGHFVVEEIKSTTILYRDEERTHEMAFAPGQTLTQVAQDHNNKLEPKESSEPARAPRPAPLRRVRRTPPIRIAAKSTSS